MSPAGKSPVMIVDDDPDILEMMMLILEASGYEVEIAMDGNAALDRLKEGVRPGVILLDMMMPILNGWAFREAQLREPELAAIPVVVFTGDGQAEAKADSVGAAGYLRKPVDLDALVAVVKRYCAPGAKDGP